MQSIYQYTQSAMNIKMRGANGRADGKHVMTGPVYICGAEPGDTVEIQILDMKPRVNPNTKKAFASNGLAAWGWQWRWEACIHVWPLLHPSSPLCMFVVSSLVRHAYVPLTQYSFGAFGTTPGMSVLK